jgi:hypothetical protein
MYSTATRVDQNVAAPLLLLKDAALKLIYCGYAEAGLSCSHQTSSECGWEVRLSWHSEHYGQSTAHVLVASVNLS